MSMIKISRLEKSFKGFKALDQLSLTVNQGEIYGFIGRNGAGKSTTMNIIAGLSRMDGGQCIVNGKDVATIHHPSELNIGYLPENPNFYAWMTAQETLQYLAVGLDATSRKKRIKDLLLWVGLEPMKNRRVGGFSRGMKQRLGIAAALIHDPELLIFDEPSSALDPQGRSDVIRLITDLKQMGKTVILSTHILSDVERVCDRIGMIDQGKMIIEDTLHNLLHRHVHPILDIEFENPKVNGLVATIEALKGVTHVAIDSHKLSVHLTHQAIVQSIMAILSQEDYSIRSLAIRKTTLEEMFVKEVAL